MKIKFAAAGVVALSMGWWCLATSAGAQGHRHHPDSLVDEVRSAIQQFADVRSATGAGYAPFLGCVSGPEEGAMGIHYVNGNLVGDGKLDVRQPEALMYEPKNGRFQLVGVEFIVLAEQWNAANTSPPTLMGQVFHYVGSPNRYGIPAFYELHVWAAKDNPHGAFADWNPRVSCEDYK
jgi:hypothetical protein